jgi:hypothetical protein
MIALRMSWVVLLACSSRTQGGPGPTPDCGADTDSDGIADTFEGSVDTDGDGMIDSIDQDSDGDGESDADERGTGMCSIDDSDMDSVPDFRDTDADNDGLTDRDEREMHGTDPTSRDTDGDGVTDLGEVAAMSDPLDPASTIPDGDFFVVLPYLGPHEVRTLRFGTDITVADVYFLIDTTGSMGEPIANVQSSLSRIATEIAGRIPDVQMGVGHFEDFPFASGSPFGSTFFGGPMDEPYENVQDITDSLGDVQAALDGLVLGDGHDGPESQVEALYQAATGESGSWSFMGASYSLPARTCESVLDEPGIRRGYPCFRPGSLPIVVMVTDLEWHNGSADGTRWPYSIIEPAPHTLPQAAMALSAIGGRFIGVVVNGMWRTDHEAVALMTGSVDEGGNPLVYPAAAGEVSDAIVEGIATLALRTPQDVTTSTENVPPNPGDVDATLFIKAITPGEGYGPAGIAGTGYREKDDVAFYGVTPGTQVDFEVDFYNDIVMPPATAQIFRARIFVLGNRVARLSERQVYIIVPPEGGMILI